MNIVFVFDIAVNVSTRNPSEQEFARYLLKRFPDMDVRHEPGPFYARNNKKQNCRHKSRTATVPDFAVTDPDNGQVAAYIELTIHSCF